MLSPGQRLRMMREGKSQSLRELEQAVGLHYSYLGALEREHKDFGKLKAEHLVTLANYFGVSVDYLLGLTPPDTERLVRLRMGRMRGPELQAFRELNHEGKRSAQVLQWLVEEGYPEFAVDKLSMRMGYTEAELSAVLAGVAAMPEALLQRISSETGLPERLFLYGDLGPSQDLVQELLDHPDAEAYFEVLALAVRNGVSPRSLRHLVQSFIVPS